MSIMKKADAMYEVRWREGGRNRSLVVHGAFELAKKIERKKLSTRDENRHLDIKRKVNFRMSELIDRYWAHYGEKKLSAEREHSIVENIRAQLGSKFGPKNRWCRSWQMVREPHDTTWTFGQHGGSALQCHAPHDGEGNIDLG